MSRPEFLTFLGSYSRKVPRVRWPRTALSGPHWHTPLAPGPPHSRSASGVVLSGTTPLASPVGCSSGVLSTQWGVPRPQSGPRATPVGWCNTPLGPRVTRLGCHNTPLGPANTRLGPAKHPTRVFERPSRVGAIPLLGASSDPRCFPSHAARHAASPRVAQAVGQPPWPPRCASDFALAACAGRRHRDGATVMEHLGPQFSPRASPGGPRGRRGGAERAGVARRRAGDRLKQGRTG